MYILLILMSDRHKIPFRNKEENNFIHFLIQKQLIFTKRLLTFIQGIWFVWSSLRAVRIPSFKMLHQEEQITKTYFRLPYKLCSLKTFRFFQSELLKLKSLVTYLLNMLRTNFAIKKCSLLKRRQLLLKGLHWGLVV